MGLRDVTAKLRAAEAASGREAGSVELVAVSKVQPLERVEAVLAEGHRVFGENRVQEAAGKWPAFRERHADVTLHLIGPLQSNKAKQAVGLFDVIQSVDRPSLAARLADAMAATGRTPVLYVQVNTGAEPQKAGVLPDATDDFVKACRTEYDFTLAGLMCIPPADDDPRPHFDLLRKLAERNGLPGLSMGMSGDFEAAVACGATCVRVGSAIFGARDYG
jgi:pyridoxal phosphate enzyme (YggS family)